MKTIAFDFPNILNPNREDPYMYHSYSEVAREKGYTVIPIADLKNPPDVFIAYKPRGYRKDFLEKMRDSYTKSIYIYPDIRDVQETPILKIAEYFDYFLTISNVPEFKKLLPNSRVCFFKQGVEPKLYDLKQPFSVDFTRRNWTFIGSYYLERKSVYNALERQKSKGKVFGNGWEECPYDVPWTRTEVYNKSFALVLNRGLVAINASYNKNISRAWSSRVYKILASGVPMLSDSVAGMKNYFKEGKTSFYYDDNQELSDMIADPLGHFGKDNLEEVALKGQQLVKVRHTYKKRGKELMEICKL